MPIQDFLLRLLGITQIIQSWHEALLGLDAGRRDKLATYADEIAATFARAAAAFAALERIPFDKPSRRDAVRSSAASPAISKTSSWCCNTPSTVARSLA